MLQTHKWKTYNYLPISMYCICVLLLRGKIREKNLWRVFLSENPVTQHFATSMKASLRPLPVVTGGDSEWLHTQITSLSSRQFNKTSAFMLVGISSGNGFPQWVSLFLQVSPLLPLYCWAWLAICFYWLWFLKVSDPFLQTSPAT